MFYRGAVQRSFEPPNGLLLPIWLFFAYSVIGKSTSRSSAVAGSAPCAYIDI